MKKIAVISEKGGVAKSLTTVSLGGCFTQRGHKVLLIDTDPQGSLSRGLIGSAAAAALPESATVAALFGSEFVAASSLLQPTRFPGLSLVPANRTLRPINCWQPSMTQYGAGQFALRDFIAEVGGDFDWVLIDSPPGLEFCAAAAGIAADAVLIPTFADADGLEAVDFTVKEVERIQAGPNRGVKLLGILLGQCEKNAVNVSYAELLRQEFPGIVLDNTVPKATAFKQARKERSPITILKPKSAASKAIGAVVDEIERRLAKAGREAA